MMARILVLDLNPQLSYPDLSIAYLVTALRTAGLSVEVQAITGIASRNQTTNQALEHNSKYLKLNLTNIQKYVENTQSSLILIPNYLNHYATVQQLATYAAHLQLPLILGGACLNTCSSEDLPLWLKLNGVTAVFVGEADWVIADVVETVLRKQDLSVWPGIYQPGMELENISAPPLQELEQLPIPDLSDFAWQTQRSALIPVLTGRTTVLENKQRIYSTRPVQAVLDELQAQAARYQHKAFIFLDSSLNTNLAMWHGLIDNIQTVVPGCHWMATIYLDGKNGLGLDLNTLVAARAAGLRHLNISLDAAQTLKQNKLLNAAMEHNRELVAHAYQAGLSVRCLISNQNNLNNLADLPNTHDFILRKLVETGQAKQQLSSIPETILHTTAKQGHLKTSQTVITPPASKTGVRPSWWQRLKNTKLINKTHKTPEVNQLV